VTKDKKAKTFVPPKGVQTACKRGLDIKDEYAGKGLVETTVNWARKMADGGDVDAAHIKKMHGWFARHKVDKKPNWARPPTPGYVAWMLWGGDAGQRWVNALYTKL
jgi:hypothetical protein